MSSWFKWSVRHAAGIALTLLAAPMHAQTARPSSNEVPPHAAAPMINAVRITDGIRVDGKLDEAAWAEAPPITGFTQLRPDEGQPATERTEVRILYDDDAIYIGARLHDSHPVSTRLTRRDQWAASDWLTVIFDSYHDHRTAFGFEVNPSGARRDQTRSPNGEDDSWDPVWQVATTIDDGGWTAEMRIPFSQLRFNPLASQVWGLQVERTLQRRNEFSVWSFTPTTHPGGIARFGHLHALDDLRVGKRLEALPYTVARADRVDRAGNPFRDDREHAVSAGVDLKYRVTSDLTLDATINPDFGQVELDPAEVNLSAIETFFSERRPFFVEGADIFAFGRGGANNVFYSRRIGRAPQLPIPGVAADVPDAARIVAAAKLSGRTSDGWSVGVLNATTERVTARTLDAGGLHGTAVAEPLTNYFVGRLRREQRDGQTVLGGMFTALNRDLDGAIARDRLHSGAYSGGMDFRHEWAGRTWLLDGFVAGTHVTGTPAAVARTQRAPWRYFQRPDADHLSLDSTATSLSGVSGEARLSLRHGRHWRPYALLGVITPGYEVNDLGFQRRGERFDAGLGTSYIENRPGTRLRQWNVSARVRNEMNFAGDLILRQLGFGAFAQTLNYWGINADVGASLPSWDDRLTRGGPMARRPAYVNGFFGVGSDWRKPVSGFTGTHGSRTAGGGWNHGIFSELEIRPAPTWSLSLSPSLNRGYTPAQFRTTVADETKGATFGRRYVFSDLRQTVLSLDTRLTMTFSPALTLQLYAQPFIASGDMGRPAELAAPRTFDFLVYGEDVGAVVQDDEGVIVHPRGLGQGGEFFMPFGDFNVRSLRGNAVLRWEWRPGSTLFVAWQQTRDAFAPVGDFDLRRDQRELWRAKPDDVLVVKVNYWLNP